MPRCLVRTSVSWKPTVNTGFSELIGSWKIIEMSAPRSFCNSPDVSARRLRPPYRIWLPGGTVAFSLGSRPRIARAVTDLPLPDSPTSATVLFAGMSKLMPLTACVTVVLSRRKSTFRSRIPIRTSAPLTGGCRSSAAPSLHRIDLAFAEKRHVVRSVQMLPPVLDAPAKRARRVQSLHQRFVDFGTGLAVLMKEPQRLLAGPLLVHLRRRLDEIALDV